MINLDQLKQLREETEAPLGECRKALEEALGDFVKAKEILRKWGKTLADKKLERETKQGIIDAYLHPGKSVGVLLELRCETDFVAKSEDFQKLSHEICLQIAAANPLFCYEKDIPQEFITDSMSDISLSVIESEKAIFQNQAKSTGKDPEILEQIVEGKWKKRKEEICLEDQPWIKDDSKKIKDLITEAIAKLGENIIIRKFSRLSIR